MFLYIHMSTCLHYVCYPSFYWHYKYFRPRVASFHLNRCLFCLDSISFFLKLKIIHYNYIRCSKTIKTLKDFLYWPENTQNFLDMEDNDYFHGVVIVSKKISCLIHCYFGLRTRHINRSRISATEVINN